jgi:hypothetical protein
MKRGIVIVLLLNTLWAFGQKENNAIGLRFSYGIGITGKHYLTKTTALEGVLHIGDNWFALTGLYQKYINLRSNLDFYYGGGLQISAWSNKYKVWGHTYSESGAGFGIAGTAGLCYNFPDIPIDVSLDFTPVIYLAPFGVNGNNLGLAVRYTF